MLWVSYPHWDGSPDTLRSPTHPGLGIPSLWGLLHNFGMGIPSLWGLLHLCGVEILTRWISCTILGWDFHPFGNSYIILGCGCPDFGLSHTVPRWCPGTDHAAGVPERAAGLTHGQLSPVPRQQRPQTGARHPGEGGAGRAGRRDHEFAEREELPEPAQQPQWAGELHLTPAPPAAPAPAHHRDLGPVGTAPEEPGGAAGGGPSVVGMEELGWSCCCCSRLRDRCGTAGWTRRGRRHLRRHGADGSGSSGSPLPPWGPRGGHPDPAGTLG